MAPHAPPRAKPQSTASTAFPQLALPTKAAAPNRVKQTRRSKNNPRTQEEQAAYDRARRESKTNHMRHVRSANDAKKVRHKGENKDRVSMAAGIRSLNEARVKKGFKKLDKRSMRCLGAKAPKRPRQKKHRNSESTPAQQDAVEAMVYHNYCTQ